MSEKTKRLGAGLTSLFGDNFERVRGNASTILHVDPNEIELNPDQPRKHFDREEISQLASSIRSHGILTPLLVTEDASEGYKYRLIAGERRLRAAKEISNYKVPVIVKKFTHRAKGIQAALIENIQRANLNPIEEAMACKALMDMSKSTQELMAKELGKSRSYIANLLRLLSLPEDVQALIMKGSLSSGHAKMLVGRKDASQLANKIVQKGLNVRQVEELLSEERKPRASKGKSNFLNSEDLRSLENIMSEKLKFKLQIKAKKNHSGEVLLKFKDFEELDNILQLLNNLR